MQLTYLLYPNLHWQFYTLFKALEVIVIVALAPGLIIIQSPVYGIIILLIAGLFYVFGFWLSYLDL